jgi:hypothetical protein
MARFSLGFLDAFIGCDAGANDRCRIACRQRGRDMGDVIRVGEDVFGKAAVLRVATELRLGAHRFPGRQAMLAMTACREEPGDANTVAFLHPCHTSADCNDQPDALMAGNKW